MLPKLLPNRLWAALKGGIDLRRGILLHRGGDVAIQVQGQRNGGVPEALLRNARMNTGHQELGSVRVAQIMKPKCRQVVHGALADEFEKHVAEPERCRWLAVRARANERVAALTDADL